MVALAVPRQSALVESERAAARLIREIRSLNNPND
jgi:hypothetical protein